MASAPSEVCPPEVRPQVASNEGTKLMMVIGVDTHKSAHAMAAVAAPTGVLDGEREIAAAEARPAVDIAPIPD